MVHYISWFIAVVFVCSILNWSRFWYLVSRTYAFCFIVSWILFLVQSAGSQLLDIFITEFRSFRSVWYINILVYIYLFIVALQYAPFVVQFWYTVDIGFLASVWERLFYVISVCFLIWFGIMIGSTLVMYIFCLWALIYNGFFGFHWIGFCSTGFVWLQGPVGTYPFHMLMYGAPFRCSQISLFKFWL